MLSEKSLPAAHAGEVQSSAPTAAPVQAWSTNNEAFEAETLSSLIITNDWLRAGDIVYVGEQQTIALSDLATSDDVIAFMSLRATVLAGVKAEGYPQVSAEQKKLLSAAIAGWIALVCPPDFFGVAEIRKHTLTDLDLDAAARVVIGGAQ